MQNLSNIIRRRPCGPIDGDGQSMHLNHAKARADDGRAVAVVVVVLTQVTDRMRSATLGTLRQHTQSISELHTINDAPNMKFVRECRIYS